jgi:PKD repeat protein
MGVSKEPVAILTLSPNPICLGNAMAWDFTGSYSPSSTVASYGINFGDSNSDTGLSGNHTYGAAGTYTVTATVTDGLGVTQTVTNEVNVIDCTDTNLLNNIYVSTDGSGVYYWD